jgi:uncharacterized hydrophobic protein (TIGR00271 family)
MRLIRLVLPTESLDDVSELLDDEGIDFVATDERSRADSVVVEFPLPVQAVDAILEALREKDLATDYTVIANAETAITEHFDELEERFVENEEDDDSVSREEVRAKARALLPDRNTYYTMTALSAFVATAGLLLDSPAVVIGSMAIAPQVGAAITACVGTVLGDRRMVIDGVRRLVVGLAFAVVSALALGWVLHNGGFFPPALDVTTIEQISSRISPGLLSLLLGLCAGVAAAYGVATDLPLSLVGVAIAAAVVPAAAAVGIGVVWGLPVVTFGAGVLLVINTASIVLAGTVTLWLLGYRPEEWMPGELRANLSRRATVVALATTLVLVAAFALPAFAMAEHVAVENSANAATQETLEQSRYQNISLVSVHTEFSAYGLTGTGQNVTVTVTRPVETSYPTLASDIAGRIRERTASDVTVAVEFVDHQQSA